MPVSLNYDLWGACFEKLIIRVLPWPKLSYFTQDYDNKSLESYELDDEQQDDEQLDNVRTYLSMMCSSKQELGDAMSCSAQVWVCFTQQSKVTS